WSKLTRSGAARTSVTSKSKDRACKRMTVPARLTRRGARSILRSSTWYPAGLGVRSRVLVLPTWDAMAALCAGPLQRQLGRCYAGTGAPAPFPGARSTQSDDDPGGCALNPIPLHRRTLNGRCWLTCLQGGQIGAHNPDPFDTFSASASL